MEAYAGVPEGDHTALITVVDTGGAVMASATVSYATRGAALALVAVPEGLSGQAGSSLDFAFGVANTGAQAGHAAFRINAGDFLQTGRDVWVEPRSKATVPFAFMIPADMPSGVYSIDYTFNGDTHPTLTLHLRLSACIKREKDLHSLHQTQGLRSSRQLDVGHSSPSAFSLLHSALDIGCSTLDIPPPSLRDPVTILDSFRRNRS